MKKMKKPDEIENYLKNLSKNYNKYYISLNEKFSIRSYFNNKDNSKKKVRLYVPDNNVRQLLLQNNGKSMYECFNEGKNADKYDSDFYDFFFKNTGKYKIDKCIAVRDKVSIASIEDSSLFKTLGYLSKFVDSNNSEELKNFLETKLL